jgi:ATP-dependent RNA helicase RhlE
MAREVDMQKRRENPDFKGAFHEKKSPKAQQPVSGKTSGKKGSPKVSGKKGPAKRTGKKFKAS